MVDRAIDVEASGLRYEVTPRDRGRGELDELLEAKRAHRATLEAGARDPHIKLAEQGQGRDVTVADIMARYR